MSEYDIDSRLSTVISKLKTSMELESNIGVNEQQNVLSDFLDMFPHLDTNNNKSVKVEVQVEKESDLDDDFVKLLCDESKNDLTDDSKVLETELIKKQKNPIEEFILDQIEINDKQYYINHLGMVWDINAELVGSLLEYDSSGKPVISFFSDKFVDDNDDNDKIIKTLKKLYL